mgnify:CR=1 FL=1
MASIDGHAGEQAVAALSGFGTDVMFTLNGGHMWPLYDAARNQGMRVVDTRHEQSATFAAEGYAKLTRRPGFAALTAGPGITNGVSAITSAHFNGSPVVVLGGGWSGIMAGIQLRRSNIDSFRHIDSGWAARATATACSLGSASAGRGNAGCRRPGAVPESRCGT